MEIQAPEFVDTKLKTVFLAGSIEMGDAEEWQKKAVRLLEPSGLTVLNPRRDDWDSSWVSSIENPKFKEQVSWELNGLENAEEVIVYFDPSTKSPITLMELGFIVGYKEAEKIHVICPDGFWKKGNVDVLCDRYFIDQYENLEGACSAINGNYSVVENMA